MNNDLLPDYFRIDRIMGDEEMITVSFVERLRGCRLYQKMNRDGKVSLPVFATKYLRENDLCDIIDDDLMQLKNDLEAESPIVNFRSSYFYNTNFLIENSYLEKIFWERIGKFSKILLKEDFSMNVVNIMSAEERRLIIGARRKLQECSRKMNK